MGVAPGRYRRPHPPTPPCSHPWHASPIPGTACPECEEYRPGRRARREPEGGSSVRTENASSNNNNAGAENAGAAQVGAETAGAEHAGVGGNQDFPGDPALEHASAENAGAEHAGAENANRSGALAQSAATDLDGEDCPICQEALHEGGTQWPGCGHGFHMRCLAGWLRGAAPYTCPTCREPWTGALPKFADEPESDPPAQPQEPQAVEASLGGATPSGRCLGFRARTAPAAPPTSTSRRVPGFACKPCAANAAARFVRCRSGTWSGRRASYGSGTAITSSSFPGPACRALQAGPRSGIASPAAARPRRTWAASSPRALRRDVPPARVVLCVGLAPCHRRPRGGRGPAFGATDPSSSPLAPQFPLPRVHQPSR